DRPQLRVEVRPQRLAVLVELHGDELVAVVDPHVDRDADVPRPRTDQGDRALLAGLAPVGELELGAHAVLAPHAVGAELPAGLLEDPARARRVVVEAEYRIVGEVEREAAVAARELGVA